jgi:histone H3/H4
MSSKKSKSKSRKSSVPITLKRNSDPRTISNSALKRLATVAGINRVEGIAYPAINQIILDLTESIARDATILAEHTNRKTLLYSDLKEAVKRSGHTLYGAKDFEYQVVKNLSGLSREKIVNLKDSVFIAKAHFARLVRSLVREVSASGVDKISKSFLENIQHFIEGRVIKILQSARVISAYAGKRVTLQKKDIEIALSTCAN